MSDFKVGDKVRLVSSPGPGVDWPIGTVGVVRDSTPVDKLVDFGCKSPSGLGHSPATGWWVIDSHLELVSPTPVGANPPEEKVVGKVFDLPAAPKRENVLEEAIRVTSGDRRRDYGSAKVNHDRIALLWAAWDIISTASDPGIATALDKLNEARCHAGDVKPSARDVAMKMILLKIAREANTPKRDNKTDICGYARCLSQIDGEEEGF